LSSETEERQEGVVPALRRDTSIADYVAACFGHDESYHEEHDAGIDVEEPKD
jgi:hypothetical protein